MHGLCTWFIFLKILVTHVPQEYIYMCIYMYIQEAHGSGFMYPPILCGCGVTK